MKVIALAVLLAVMQAGPPVPRKAADPGNRTAQHAKEQPDSNKTPTQQPSPLLKPISPEPDQTASHSPATDNAPKPIIVREVPPVSVSKDWLDKLYILFTGILIVVGSFGVRAAYKTLKAIETQASVMGEQRQVMLGQLRTMQEQISEMSAQSGILQESVNVARDAAEASKSSVALTINKERARIRVVKPETVSLGTNGPVYVEFKLLFYGTTPAYEVNSAVSLTTSDSRDSFTVPSQPRLYELPTVVSLSDIKPSYRAFLMKPLIVDEGTLDSITKLELFLHFSGIIKYDDFSGETQETAFHYLWNAPDNSPNSLRRLLSTQGWEEVGGDKENYYT